jgi:O-acetyl-ADP-ribose deacetylase (regulator of RNase III)
MPSAYGIIVGDITRLDVDAIVNAANSGLLGGGGVDGAIHRAAGPRLRDTCRRLQGCPTGEARITPGFDLMARFVIHTVGPVWQGGERGEAALLASCYRRCLELAEEQRVQSIAFPSISTGAYGFPIARAARIATATVIDVLPTLGSLRSVVQCCFSERDAQIYRAALAKTDR